MVQYPPDRSPGLRWRDAKSSPSSFRGVSAGQAVATHPGALRHRDARGPLDPPERLDLGETRDDAEAGIGSASPTSTSSTLLRDRGAAESPIITIQRWPSLVGGTSCSCDPYRGAMDTQPRSLPR